MTVLTEAKPKTQAMLDLSEKVIMVSGASRGIGREIAENLATCGASVSLCSTKDAVARETATSLSTENQQRHLGRGVDVTDEAAVQAWVKETVDTFGRIDGLVNNAGITQDNLLLRMSFEEWQKVINTNLNSAFLCSKAVLRTMLKQKSGHIVNISSVVGLMGNPGQANYAASKAGLIAFSKSLAKEYGAKGLRSNVVAPGFIETDMIQSLPEDYLDNIISQVPLKRLGKASEVSNLVAFLLSDLSPYITGQVLQIDGGILM